MKVWTRFARYQISSGVNYESRTRHTSIGNYLVAVGPEEPYHELTVFSYLSHPCADQRPHSMCQNGYSRGSAWKPTSAGACGPEPLLFLVSI